jgi:hypothetical protein
MPKGLGTAGGAEGPVLYGDARPNDGTVSRSLFPACLHTCKHSLHNTKMSIGAKYLTAHIPDI